MPESSEDPSDLRVARISSVASGQGPERPWVVLAPSATSLSRAIGASITNSGTYLATYWGEKPTGGYSLAVESACLKGNRVTVRLALRESSPDAAVTRALTYPYAVAVMRDLDPPLANSSLSSISAAGSSAGRSGSRVSSGFRCSGRVPATRNVVARPAGRQGDVGVR
jgi:hypothetical protein